MIETVPSVPRKPSAVIVASFFGILSYFIDNNVVCTDVNIVGKSICVAFAIYES